MENGNDNWKNWAIAGLWAVSMGLSGLGYHSIKGSIEDISKAFQVAQTKDNEWKLEYERHRAVIWRTMDKLCNYQAERLYREGKTPNYNIQEVK
ncbi:MAG: hypothetical protein WC593_14995 [Methanoregula sp.]